MSDSYGSLAWYRNLSEADKVFVASYGRDALIQKQKLEQQQQPQQVEETEEEQVEETEETETIEDPLFEQKQSQLEQKQRILDLLEKQANELNEFSNYLAVPQWREVIKDYINLVEFVIKGYANNFALLVKMSEDGQKLNFEHEFYDKTDKPIKQLNPEVAIQSVEGK